jgi:hypothetical protein
MNVVVFFFLILFMPVAFRQGFSFFFSVSFIFASPSWSIFFYLTRSYLSHRQHAHPFNDVPITRALPPRYATHFPITLCKRNVNISPFEAKKMKHMEIEGKCMIRRSVWSVMKNR